MSAAVSLRRRRRARPSAASGRNAVPPADAHGSPSGLRAAVERGAAGARGPRGAARTHQGAFTRLSRCRARGVHRSPAGAHRPRPHGHLRRRLQGLDGGRHLRTTAARGPRSAPDARTADVTSTAYDVMAPCHERRRARRGAGRRQWRGSRARDEANGWWPLTRHAGRSRGVAQLRRSRRPSRVGPWHATEHSRCRRWTASATAGTAAS